MDDSERGALPAGLEQTLYHKVSLTVPKLQMLTVMLRCGARVGVFGGKVEGLLDDIAALKPTILAGVPRVFNRVHDK
jgi:long-subunit acyl-CoA synthetase (AMP-forming)